MCMHAQRYCHLQIQDQDVGSVLGYANGESWFRPFKQLRAEYGGKYMKIRRLDRPWMADKTLANLTAQIRETLEPLVVVFFSQPLWLDGFDRWLQHEPPVLAARNTSVPPNTPFHLAQRRIDRCFCRYVSHPIFLSNLPEELARRVRRVQARRPEVAVHLRTMINHLPEWSLTGRS